MKKILLIVILFLGFQKTDAQNNNHIFLEVGGNAGLYSINYERNLHKNLAVRIGGSYYSNEGEHYVAFPLLVNYRFHTKFDIYLEFGAGVTLVDDKLTDGTLGDLTFDNHVPTGVMAICFDYKSGTNLRISYCPVYYKERHRHHIGFSFGVKF